MKTADSNGSPDPGQTGKGGRTNRSKGPSLETVRKVVDPQEAPNPMRIRWEPVTLNHGVGTARRFYLTWKVSPYESVVFSPVGDPKDLYEIEDAVHEAEMPTLDIRDEVYKICGIELLMIGYYSLTVVLTPALDWDGDGIMKRVLEILCWHVYRERMSKGRTAVKISEYSNESDVVVVFPASRPPKRKNKKR